MKQQDFLATYKKNPLFKKALFDLTRKLQKEPPTPRSTAYYEAMDKTKKPDEHGPFIEIFEFGAALVNVSRIIWEGWNSGIKDRTMMIYFVQKVELLINKSLSELLKTKIEFQSNEKIFPEMEPFWDGDMPN